MGEDPLENAVQRVICNYDYEQYPFEGKQIVHSNTYKFIVLQSFGRFERQCEDFIRLHICHVWWVFA